MKLQSFNQQITGFVLMLVIIFSTALILVFTNVIMQSMNVQINQSNGLSDDGKLAFSQVAQTFAILDYAIIFVTIGYTLLLILSSFYIPTSNIFLIVNIFGLLTLPFISAVLTNIYYEIIGNPSIAPYMLNMTKTSTFMYYLPRICFLIILLVTIIMYSKGGTSQADPGNPYV